MNPDGFRTARRLSIREVVHGAARSLRPEAAGQAVPSEDAEEYRFGFERGYTDGLRQARTELEAAAEQARAEWERQAQAALDEARSAAEQARDRLANVSEALAGALEEDRRWAESAAVEMAYTALLRVFGDRAGERSLVAELCAQARRSIGGDVITVRVAPDDAEAVRAACGAATVIADAGIPAGGCVLESRRGHYDAGLASRLEQLREALLASLYEGGERA